MQKTFCNICGKEFDMWDKQEDFGFCYSVGYGSKFDGSYIDVDLCCDCFDELMDTYIIPKCKESPVQRGCDVDYD